MRKRGPKDFALANATPDSVHASHSHGVGCRREISRLTQTRQMDAATSIPFVAAELATQEGQGSSGEEPRCP